MNYHSDEWIMNEVKKHYNESLQYFPGDRIVGCFYQGSGNYGLDYEGSDVDTKLVVVPTFKDIAMNKKPISTTHIRDNEEHTDWKDIRLYVQTFRKQNLNFLEILFTPYKIVNQIYEDQWNMLVECNEEIAHYSPTQSIKSMRGIAKEKYFALEHHYPARMEWINKFGYDPKQLHHLLRVEEYIERYISGESYLDCLHSKKPEFLKDIKAGICYNLEEARIVAKNAITNIDNMCDNFLKEDFEINKEVDYLLDEVQYEIMKNAVMLEIKN